MAVFPRLQPVAGLLLSFSFFFGSILADQFTNPSNSVADLTTTYELGQVVQLAWETSLQEVTLLVSHWGGNDVGALLSDATNPGVFSWTIGQGDNINQQLLSSTTNFVLILRSPSGCPSSNGWVDCQLQSRGFRIINNVTTAATTTSASSSSASSASSSSSATSSKSASSSSHSSSSATSSASSSSATSASASAASSSSSSSSSPPASPTTSASSSASTTTTIPLASSSAQGSGGLSTGAKAGIGIGAALGALALVAAGVGITICVMRRSKRRSQGQHSTADSSAFDGSSAPQVVPSGYQYMSQPALYKDYKPPQNMSPPPSELQTNSYVPVAIHELGGDGSPRGGR